MYCNRIVPIIVIISHALLFELRVLKMKC